MKASPSWVFLLLSENRLHNYSFHKNDRQVKTEFLANKIRHVDLLRSFLHRGGWKEKPSDMLWKGMKLSCSFLLLLMYVRKYKFDR